MPPGRRLYVLRHAKSSWEDPGLDDHDRALASRGVKAAGLLREYVRTEGIAPEVVLCSSARRTVETLEGVAPTGAVAIEHELFGASWSDVVRRLREIPQETASVMVIGHNPTMQVLVLRLVEPGRAGEAQPVDGLRAQVEQKFPTGALATLAFECEWSGLGPGCAALVGYVRPKQLQ